jgi:diamine N-acetyltransferase
VSGTTESTTGEVSLRPVTKETARAIMALKVAPGQDRFVAPNAVSIAQAYFDREIAWFRGVYAGDEPVGFVMLEDDPAKGSYYLWRFMIDARHQRGGIGRRAIDLVIAHVRTRPGATELKTSVVPGEGSPGPFYEKLGFAYTGEVDDGELVMRLGLAPESKESAR